MSRFTNALQGSLGLAVGMGGLYALIMAGSEPLYRNCESERDVNVLNSGVRYEQNYLSIMNDYSECITSKKEFEEQYFSGIILLGLVGAVAGGVFGYTAREAGGYE